MSSSRIRTIRTSLLAASLSSLSSRGRRGMTTTTTTMAGAMGGGEGGGGGRVSSAASNNSPPKVLPKRPIRYLSRPIPPATTTTTTTISIGTSSSSYGNEMLSSATRRRRVVAEPFRPEDLQELGNQIQKSEERKYASYDLGRRINAQLARVKCAMDTCYYHHTSDVNVSAAAAAATTTSADSNPIEDEDGENMISRREEEERERELDELMAQVLNGSSCVASPEENKTSDINEVNDTQKEASKEGHLKKQTDDLTTTITTTTAAAAKAATIDPTRVPREANLSNRIEDYIRHKSILYFLSTGTLIPPSHYPLISDEEYIGGACIGLTQDLARYGIGRAIVRDVSSVMLATELVRGVVENLLQFDFRNGPLRRKYDGVKYALKTLETILYELSVTGCCVTGTSTTADAATEEKEEGNNKETKGKENDNDNDVEMKMEEPERKRSRSNNDTLSSDGRVTEEAMETSPIDATTTTTTTKDTTTTTTANDDDSGNLPTPKAKDEKPIMLIPQEELTALRLRMEHRDELRENLIKKCRDGQKMAKQSIFALHRGDVFRARKLLKQCELCIVNELRPVIEQEPALRYGSFSNVMEEYVEGKLFFAWLLGNTDDDDDDADDGSHGTVRKKLGALYPPRGVVLLPKDFELHLEPDEYLGGLCDLTGEIGRYAVQRGTARDSAGVRMCLETNMSILTALLIMEKLPGGIGKKLDQLRRSVEKLERMLYEMSLVEATGGTRNVSAESVGDNRDEEESSQV